MTKKRIRSKRWHRALLWLSTQVPGGSICKRWRRILYSCEKPSDFLDAGRGEILHRFNAYVVYYVNGSPGLTAGGALALLLHEKTIIGLARERGWAGK